MMDGRSQEFEANRIVVGADVHNPNETESAAVKVLRRKRGTLKGCITRRLRSMLVLIAASGSTRSLWRLSHEVAERIKELEMLTRNMMNIADCEEEQNDFYKTKEEARMVLYQVMAYLKACADEPATDMRRQTQPSAGSGRMSQELEPLHMAKPLQPVHGVQDENAMNETETTLEPKDNETVAKQSQRQARLLI